MKRLKITTKDGRKFEYRSLWNYDFWYYLHAPNIAAISIRSFLFWKDLNIGAINQINKIYANQESQEFKEFKELKEFLTKVDVTSNEF